MPMAKTASLKNSVRSMSGPLLVQCSSRLYESPFASQPYIYKTLRCPEAQSSSVYQAAEKVSLLVNRVFTRGFSASSSDAPPAPPPDP